MQPEIGRSANIEDDRLISQKIVGNLVQLETLSKFQPSGGIDNQTLYQAILPYEGGETVVSTEKSAFLYCYWSRSVDIFFGICGGVLLLVMLPMVSLLIYLDSPGPIFYSQTRLGYQKRLFRIYKFRSMYPASGRTGHMIWAKVHDSRITRFGRFLRATHLDELPQMLNILRGEMSLIGPRPELPTFSNELEENIPYYNQRFSIKPGLTGWAQVKHHYGDTIEDERIKLQYDLAYIKNRSYPMDISIIIRTVVEVVSGHGR